MNRQLTSKEIKLVIKKTAQQTKSSNRWLHSEFYQIYKEELMPILKLLQKTIEEGKV